jgi:Raf kinase inhibitor-like YbhB/YbcL family protein
MLCHNDVIAKEIEMRPRPVPTPTGLAPPAATGLALPAVTGLALLAAATVLALAGCGADARQPAAGGAAPAGFAVGSPDVGADGVGPEWAIGTFPGLCVGENRSLNLEWAGTPEGTVSFAVTMADGGYGHWVVTDIPATATGLASAPDGQVSEGIVGSSVAGFGAYIGLCIPGNEYTITVYALDTELTGNAGTSVSAVESEVAGHVLARASMTVATPGGDTTAGDTPAGDTTAGG